MAHANIYDENKARREDSNGRRFATCLASLSVLAAGDVVVLDATNSTSAITAVKRIATAKTVGVFGVATGAITSGAYGEIQTYGWTATCKIDGTTTSVAIGDSLATGTVAAKANKGETADNMAPGMYLGQCAETVASGSDETFAVFIDPR